MFYKDIIVELPVKKRIRKNSKGPNYVYEITSRKNKDGNKDKSKCVGILTNDNKMHPNDNYFMLHNDITNNIVTKENMFSSTINIGAHILLRKISNDLGINSLLNYHFPKYSELIQSIVQYSLLTKSTDIKLFPYYLFDNYSLFKQTLDYKTINMIFDEQINCFIINDFLKDWLKNNINDNVDIHFNYSNKHSSYTEDLDSSQTNHVYYTNSNNGLPLYYETFYGCITVLDHLISVKNSIQSINNNINTTFIMDSNYFNSDNIKYLIDNNLNFICLGNKCKKFYELIDEFKDDISDFDNRVYKTIYGIKTKGRIEYINCDLNLYLFYNEADIAYNVSNKVDMLESVASLLIGKNDKNKTLQNSFGEMIDIITDSNDVIVSANINYDYIHKYRNNIGYYLFVSNEDLSCKELFNRYYNRINIDLNNNSEVYVEPNISNDSIMFISFLGYIFKNIIINKCKDYFLKCPSENVDTILHELNKIKIDLINNKYILKYSLNEKQKELFDIFDINSDYISKIINEYNR